LKIITHNIGDSIIAEIESNEIIISNSQDGVDLLGNLYYQNFDKIIIYEQNLSKSFFDLKNGIAGDILQKFSNYRVRLAIVGDFSNYTGKSIRDFIYESNNVKHINFVPNLQEALKLFSEI
jgi:hypothetical protein